MRIAFGSRINTNLSQLTQLSSTFKKWWDTPGDKGKPSRKEQFQQLLKERPKIVEQVLRSLDGYLAKPLTSRHTQNLGKTYPHTPQSPNNTANTAEGPTAEEGLPQLVRDLDAVLKEYSTEKPLPKPPMALHKEGSAEILPSGQEDVFKGHREKALPKSPTALHEEGSAEILPSGQEDVFKGHREKPLSKPPMALHEEGSAEILPSGQEDVFKGHREKPLSKPPMALHEEGSAEILPSGQEDVFKGHREKALSKPPMALHKEGSAEILPSGQEDVFKGHREKPLPRPPAQTFPKAMYVPNKPIPKAPTQAFPKVPSQPVPPPPLDDTEAASNIAALKQDLEDARKGDASTFQKAQASALKTQASNENERANSALASHRMVKPQRPLTPVPEEKQPPLPPKASASISQAKSIHPPRRKVPERKNKNLDSSTASPTMATAKARPEPLKGPSEAQNQDISFMMQALVKMRMDKAVLRDILLLNDNKSNPISKERELRGINILKERGIIAKNASDLKGLDIGKVRELFEAFESNERKLQANVDSWYEKHGGGIQF